MWFQLFFGIVLVQIVSFNLAKDPKPNDSNRETDAIFAGVIKNISRVNSVLQDLINNYEQLQKIYKSQENLEIESSDGEIDEVYKSKKRKEDKQYRNKLGQSRSDDIVTTTMRSTPGKDGYPATQMIWSDDDKSKDDSEIISTDDEESDTANQMKKDETEIHIEDKLPDPTTEQTTISNDEEKKSIAKKKRKTKHTNDTPQKEAEVIFIDTRTTTKRKRVKPSLEPLIEISLQTTTSKPPDRSGLKTRYSKVSQSNRDKKHKKKRPDYLRLDPKPKEPREVELFDTDFAPTNMSNEAKAVEKQVHSELFSNQNIWDDIMSNKPIQLEAHSGMTFDKMRKDGKEDQFHSNQKFRQRSKDKTKESDKEQNKPLVIVEKKNQSTNTKSILSDSSKEDGVKEEFQAKALRKAYGDACLKLVIKKCYKACKAAGKMICEKYKCKNTYRESYQKHSRTGCLKEFNIKAIKKKDLQNKTNKAKGKGKGFKGELVMEDEDDVDDASILPRADGKSNSDSSSEEFTKVDASEYLRSCLPHIQTETRRSGIGDTGYFNSSFHLPAEPPPTLNILRDKYERACSQISFDKCQAACRYAYTKVCESFTCNSSRKREYKRVCANQCRASYKSGGGRMSSDSSDYSSSY